MTAFGINLATNHSMMQEYSQEKGVIRSTENEVSNF